MAMNDTEMEAGAGGYGALPDTSMKRPQTFKKAFASARAAGDKVFTWQGKKYTTDTAPDKAPAPAKTATRVGTERGRRETPKPAEDMRAGHGTGMAPQYALSDVERPGTNVRYENKDTSDMAYKKGGKVKCYAKGGSVRGGGCESRGKTKGRMV